MPRIAEGRTAVQPSSPDQHARQSRILEAAGALASETDLEHVQMHEVAKRASVAIGTLYRYFPSKTHLFVGVLVNEIERMGDALAKRAHVPGNTAERVFDVLVRANRALLGKPKLAAAMMKSSGSADATAVSGLSKIDRTMSDVLFAAAGIPHPTVDDLAMMRVLLQAWAGILQSSLNGRLSMPEAESDLRLACRLLLAGSSVARDDPPTE